MVIEQQTTIFLPNSHDYKDIFINIHCAAIN